MQTATGSLKNRRDDNCMSQAQPMQRLAAQANAEHHAMHAARKISRIPLSPSCDMTSVLSRNPQIRYDPTVNRAVGKERRPPCNRESGLLRSMQQFWRTIS
jgi:hypothetical protein